jgi:hypothetical protein
MSFALLLVTLAQENLTVVLMHRSHVPAWQFAASLCCRFIEVLAQSMVL